MSKYQNKSARKSRREGAYHRLEAQILSNRKTTNLSTGHLTEELSEKDIKRIKKEMDTLKTRI